MAKDFGKSGAVNNINKIALKDEANSGFDKQVKLSAGQLVVCPFNDEILSYTDDLEESYKTQPIINPLIVTDFEMEPNKYMIVAGNRRFTAGEKFGYVKKWGLYPCIIKHYASKLELEEAIADANQGRNEDIDALVYIRRVKKYTSIYDRSNIDESKREYLSRKLGLSLQSVDRYIACSKLIDAALELIEKRLCPNSGMMYLAKYNETQQAEIVELLNQTIKYASSTIKDFKTLPREIVKTICNTYGMNNNLSIEQIKPYIDRFNPEKRNVSTSSQVTDNKDSDVEHPLRNDEVNYNKSGSQFDDKEKKKYEDEPNEEDMEVAQAAHNKAKNNDDRIQVNSVIKNALKLEKIVTDYIEEDNEEKEEDKRNLINILKKLSEEIKDAIDKIES